MAREKLSKKVNDSEEVKEETVRVSSRASSRFNKILIIVIIIAVVLGAVLFFASRGTDDKSNGTKTGESVATVEGAPAASVDADESDEADTTSSGDGGKPWLSSSADTSDDAEAKPVVPVVQEAAPDGKTVPGITDPSVQKYNTNYSKIEKDTYTKGINGKTVLQHYKIEPDSITTKIDFVSYTKHRATTDTGIELYWLDAQYKGKKAKIQVPFRIFNQLDPVGVTVCDVEYVEIPTEDDSSDKEPETVVTGFTVRDDYKRILDEHSEDGSY